VKNVKQKKTKISYSTVALYDFWPGYALGLYIDAWSLHVTTK